MTAASPAMHPKLTPQWLSMKPLRTPPPGRYGGARRGTHWLLHERQHPAHGFDVQWWELQAKGVSIIVRAGGREQSAHSRTEDLREKT